MKAEDFHLLNTGIDQRVLIGSISKRKDKKLSGNFVISENNIDRTDEFLNMLAKLYKNSTWRIKSKSEKLHCLIMDEDLINKNKDKTISEIFKLNNAFSQLNEVEGK